MNRLSSLVSLVTSAALAVQTQPVPSQPPQPEPPPREPTLDELLGLTKPRDPATEPDTPADETDLERALLGRSQVDDDFVHAVELMDRVAGRLNTSKDTGLETQRLQDEILRKLDKILDDAQKQQSSSSSKSSQQQQQQRQQQQQQQKQSSQSQQQQQKTSGEQAGPGPGRQDGALREPDPAASAAWGNLPPHVRDALMQGLSDRFSAMYERLTREYYERLAEDEPRDGSLDTRP
jgi:DNA primase